MKPTFEQVCRKNREAIIKALFIDEVDNRDLARTATCEGSKDLWMQSALKIRKLREQLEMAR